VAGCGWPVGAAALRSGGGPGRCAAGYPAEPAGGASGRGGEGRGDGPAALAWRRNIGQGLPGRAAGAPRNRRDDAPGRGPACAAAVAALLPWPAAAAGIGAELSLAWGIPFLGLLLSIALLPVLAGHVGHHHYGKIAAGWTAALVLPFAAAFGPEAAAAEVWHILLQEYVPFIALLLALYVTGAGCCCGLVVGTPP